MVCEENSHQFEGIRPAGVNHVPCNRQNQRMEYYLLIFAKFPHIEIFPLKPEN
jgi:hypothetical protein